MTDLVSGRYGAYEPLWRLLGMPTNATQSDVPVRTNATVLGLSTLVDMTTTNTKKGPMVAVPVQEGDVFTKVACLIGAKEGAAGQAFFAVYSAPAAKTEGTLLGQTTFSEAAQVKSTIFTGTLESAILITSANAPHGYVYAGLVVETATVPSEVGVEVPTVWSKTPWFTGCPEALSVEATQKAAKVASATLATETAIAKVPFIFLY
jgi:hypothetical protein